MTVTIAPMDEALDALVAKINLAETGYILDVPASSTYLQIDKLEEVHETRVDVVAGKVKQLAETLDASDNASLAITIWIRSPLPQENQNEAIEYLNLMTRLIFLQLRNFKTSNRRVEVWECAQEETEEPLKAQLNSMGRYLARLKLRVEVMP